MAPFFCGQTGGSLRDLDFVLWEMRLTVLLQLCHWKLRAADVWTVPPGEPSDALAQRGFQQLATARVQM